MGRGRRGKKTCSRSPWRLGCSKRRSHAAVTALAVSNLAEIRSTQGLSMEHFTMDEEIPQLSKDQALLDLLYKKPRPSRSQQSKLQFLSKKPTLGPWEKTDVRPCFVNIKPIPAPCFQHSELLVTCEAHERTDGRCLRCAMLPNTPPVSFKHVCPWLWENRNPLACPPQDPWRLRAWTINTVSIVRKGGLTRVVANIGHSIGFVGAFLAKAHTWRNPPPRRSPVDFFQSRLLICT